MANMGYSIKMLMKESPEASTITVLIIPVVFLTELSDRIPSLNLVTRYSGTK